MECKRKKLHLISGDRIFRCSITGDISEKFKDQTFVDEIGCFLVANNFPYVASAEDEGVGKTVLISLAQNNAIEVSCECLPPENIDASVIHSPPKKKIAVSVTPQKSNSDTADICNKMNNMSPYKSKEETKSCEVEISGIPAPFFEKHFLHSLEKSAKEQLQHFSSDAKLICGCSAYNNAEESITVRFVSEEVASDVSAIQMIYRKAKLHFKRTETMNAVSVMNVPSPFFEDYFVFSLKEFIKENYFVQDDNVQMYVKCTDHDENKHTVVVEISPPDIIGKLLWVKHFDLDGARLTFHSYESKKSSYPAALRQLFNDGRTTTRAGLSSDLNSSLSTACRFGHGEGEGDSDFYVGLQGLSTELSTKNSSLSGRFGRTRADSDSDTFADYPEKAVEHAEEAESDSDLDDSTRTETIALTSEEGTTRFLRNIVRLKSAIETGNHAAAYARLAADLSSYENVDCDVKKLQGKRKYLLATYNTESKSGHSTWKYFDAVGVLKGDKGVECLTGTMFDPKLCAATEDETFAAQMSKYVAGAVWNNKAIKALMAAYSLYKDRFDNPIRHTRTWKKIRQELEKENFFYTAGQCERKMELLKKQYRNEAGRLGQTGAPGPSVESTWKYFGDMQEIMADDVTVEPFLTLSAGSSNTMSSRQRGCEEPKKSSKVVPLKERSVTALEKLSEAFVRKADMAAEVLKRRAS